MRHLPFGPSSTERMRPRRLRVLDLSPSTAYFRCLKTFLEFLALSEPRKQEPICCLVRRSRSRDMFNDKLNQYFLTPCLHECESVNVQEDKELTVHAYEHVCRRLQAYKHADASI